MRQQQLSLGEFNWDLMSALCKSMEISYSISHPKWNWNFNLFSIGSGKKSFYAEREIQVVDLESVHGAFSSLLSCFWEVFLFPFTPTAHSCDSGDVPFFSHLMQAEEIMPWSWKVQVIQQKQPAIRKPEFLWWLQPWKRCHILRALLPPSKPSWLHLKYHQRNDISSSPIHYSPKTSREWKQKCKHLFSGSIFWRSESSEELKPRSQTSEIIRQRMLKITGESGVSPVPL